MKINKIYDVLISTENLSTSRTVSSLTKGRIFIDSMNAQLPELLQCKVPTIFKPKKIIITKLKGHHFLWPFETWLNHHSGLETFIPSYDLSYNHIFYIATSYSLITFHAI